MATLTVSEIVIGGIDESLAAADVAGDEFTLDNGKSHFIVINNGDVSSMNVTVKTYGEIDGAPTEDRVVAVGAGERKMVGPFPKRTYGDANGKVQLTYSSVTSLTVGAFQISTFAG